MQSLTKNNQECCHNQECCQKTIRNVVNVVITLFQSVDYSLYLEHIVLNIRNSQRIEIKKLF